MSSTTDTVIDRSTSPSEETVSSGKSRTGHRRRWYLAGLGLIAIAWAQSGIRGPSSIEDFVRAVSLGSIKREMLVVDDAAEAAELAKRGIEAPHWLYVGNARSPFPMVVSVDTDFVHSDLWWCRRRLYFFWCFGQHPKEPFFNRLLEDDLQSRQNRLR